MLRQLAVAVLVGRAAVEEEASQGLGSQVVAAGLGSQVVAAGLGNQEVAADLGIQEAAADLESQEAATCLQLRGPLWVKLLLPAVRQVDLVRVPPPEIPGAQ